MPYHSKVSKPALFHLFEFESNLFPRKTNTWKVWTHYKPPAVVTPIDRSYSTVAGLAALPSAQSMYRSGTTDSWRVSFATVAACLLAQLRCYRCFKNIDDIDVNISISPPLNLSFPQGGNGGRRLKRRTFFYIIFNISQEPVQKPNNAMAARFVQKIVRAV